MPQSVSFNAADGWTIHGQLFEKTDGAGHKPGMIFVHGGPPRQMLLGWHYMDYYSNAYAVNQYLANHGFVVLSVNYRLGIGYGHAFHHPAHAGPTGAAEYQDVVAGAKFLQGVDGVDPEAHRHLGRFLWRLSDGDGARAQLRHLQGRRRHARRARLVALPGRHGSARAAEGATRRATWQGRR